MITCVNITVYYVIVVMRVDVRFLFLLLEADSGIGNVLCERSEQLHTILILL